MRSYSILLVFLMAMLSKSCMMEVQQEEFILFNQISKINLSSNQLLFFSADSVAKLELKVEYMDRQGKVINYLEKFHPELWIDNEKAVTAEIPLQQIKNYTISLKLNEALQSNEISIAVLPFRESIKKIDFVLNTNKTKFLQHEDTIPISHYFEIAVKDLHDRLYRIPLDMNEVDLLIDQKKVAKDKLLPSDLATGSRSFAIQIGELKSNEETLQIIHPASEIKSIAIDFDDETRNRYALAGVSRYSFKHRIENQEGMVLNFKNHHLMINNRVHNSTQDILLQDGGELEVYLESYGKKSNPLLITSRPKKNYEKKLIPVIFHIVHNGDEVGSEDNATSQTIYSEIVRVNFAFANKPETSLPKCLNAVDLALEIIPATNNPQGEALTEKGINRIKIEADFFNKEETGAFMFNHMWDPNEYLNIFVLKINPNSSNESWAYYPTMGQPLAGINYTATAPKLNYPYATMLNNRHFNTFVLTHELGHNLALYHSWSPTSCHNSDYVNDTQDYVNIPSNVSGHFRFDCENRKFRSTNYMDYNVGARNSFTYDQRERMRYVYEHAHFFPRNSSQLNGRKLEARSERIWKGTYDQSIQPIECPYSFDD